MSEIEKLYENANAGKDCKLYPNYFACPDKTKECTYCEYYDYPKFTAKKQIALIKWLANKTIKIVRFDNCFYFGTKFEPCKEDGGCFAGCEEIEFTEALTGLINNLWQDLTETEKAEIKRILE